MAKKRPTLDAFLNSQPEGEVNDGQKPTLSSLAPKTAKTLTHSKNSVEGAVSEGSFSSVTKPNKHEVVRHMLYIPLPVYDQLQALIFEEQRGQARRRKTHDYLLDAIDLLFKKKGLKSIAELVKKED